MVLRRGIGGLLIPPTTPREIEETEKKLTCKEGEAAIQCVEEQEQRKDKGRNDSWRINHEWFRSVGESKPLK